MFRKKFRCITAECDNTGMLSQDLSHLARRSQCINKFARAYPRMPLKSVEFRADPVLYRNDLPPSVQVYSDIGKIHICSFTFNLMGFILKLSNVFL